MASGYDQDKTEPATPKKREDARRKGQVAHSREVSSVIVLFSALSVFYLAGDWMFGRLSGIAHHTLSHLFLKNFKIETAHVLLWEIFQHVFILLAPLFLTVAVGGIVANVSQIGFLLTAKPLTPKLSKLNPVNGFKRLFSARSLVETVKSVLKVLIIGGVTYGVLSREMDEIPALVQLNISQVLAFIGHAALKLGFYACLVLVVLAGIDLVFQRWQHERDLRMSKQEVRDEHKQREGDPMVRSRIRAIQREMAMQRMMASVPEATVVITNPTHLAIALKFDRSMPAPLVVAKGAGVIAGRIRDIAGDHDIPIVEQKPLARALYKSVDIDQYIPGELYHAVAEILAYVYRLKGMA
jgi:flagellar biosynthetic protein FlhB